MAMIYVALFDYYGGISTRSDLLYRYKIRIVDYLRIFRKIIIIKPIIVFSSLTKRL